MQTLAELGQEVSARRRQLGLKQGLVAVRAGVSQGFLSRFERGRVAEAGARKLLAVLAVLELELTYSERGVAGGLEELRKERGGQ